MPLSTEMQNKPENYTTDCTTSKPDSRLSTFIKGCKELTQIYSVEPLVYTDIIGEYWQRINDIIFTLGLTETEEIVTNIGWTVPIIGKQRTDLVTEELGTLNTRNDEIINPAEAECGSFVAGYGTSYDATKNNPVTKNKAHKYGLIQSIDRLFSRNIETWGNLYDYFYNNLNSEKHPKSLANMIFGDTYNSNSTIIIDIDGTENEVNAYDYYMGRLTTSGAITEIVNLIDTFGKDFYDWLNTTKDCIFSYDIDESKSGPNSLEELFFDGWGKDEELTWCEYFKGLPSKGLLVETYNMVNYLGDNYYNYVNYINYQKNPEDENNPANPENTNYVEYDPESNPLLVLSKIDIGQVLYGNKKYDTNGNQYTVYENDYIDKSGYICENDYDVATVKNYHKNQKNIFDKFIRLSISTLGSTDCEKLNNVYPKIISTNTNPKSITVQDTPNSDTRIINYGSSEYNSYINFNEPHYRYIGIPFDSYSDYSNLIDNQTDTISLKTTRTCTINSTYRTPFNMSLHRLLLTEPVIDSTDETSTVSSITNLYEVKNNKVTVGYNTYDAVKFIKIDNTDYEVYKNESGIPVIMYDNTTYPVIDDKVVIGNVINEVVISENDYNYNENFVTEYLGIIVDSITYPVIDNTITINGIDYTIGSITTIDNTKYKINSNNKLCLDNNEITEISYNSKNYTINDNIINPDYEISEIENITLYEASYKIEDNTVIVKYFNIGNLNSITKYSYVYNDIMHYVDVDDIITEEGINYNGEFYPVIKDKSKAILSDNVMYDIIKSVDINDTTYVIDSSIENNSFVINDTTYVIDLDNNTVTSGENSYPISYHVNYNNDNISIIKCFTIYNNIYPITETYGFDYDNSIIETNETSGNCIIFENQYQYVNQRKNTGNKVYYYTDNNSKLIFQKPLSVLITNNGPKPYSENTESNNFDIITNNNTYEINVDTNTVETGKVLINSNIAYIIKQNKFVTINNITYQIYETFVSDNDESSYNIVTENNVSSFAINDTTYVIDFTNNIVTDNIINYNITTRNIVTINDIDYEIEIPENNSTITIDGINYLVKEETSYVINPNYEEVLVISNNKITVNNKIIEIPKNTSTFYSTIIDGNYYVITETNSTITLNDYEIDVAIIENNTFTINGSQYTINGSEITVSGSEPIIISDNNTFEEDGTTYYIKSYASQYNSETVLKYKISKISSIEFKYNINLDNNTVTIGENSYPIEENNSFVINDTTYVIDLDNNTVTSEENSYFISTDTETNALYFIDNILKTTTYDLLLKNTYDYEYDSNENLIKTNCIKNSIDYIEYANENYVIDTETNSISISGTQYILYEIKEKQYIEYNGIIYQIIENSVTINGIEYTEINDCILIGTKYYKYDSNNSNILVDYDEIIDYVIIDENTYPIVDNTITINDLNYEILSSNYYNDKDSNINHIVSNPVEVFDISNEIFVIEQEQNTITINSNTFDIELVGSHYQITAVKSTETISYSITLDTIIINGETYTLNALGTEVTTLYSPKKFFYINDDKTLKIPNHYTHTFNDEIPNSITVGNSTFEINSYFVDSINNTYYNELTIDKSKLHNVATVGSDTQKYFVTYNDENDIYTIDYNGNSYELTDTDIPLNKIFIIPGTEYSVFKISFYIDSNYYDIIEKDIFEYNGAIYSFGDSNKLLIDYEEDDTPIYAIKDNNYAVINSISYPIETKNVIEIITTISSGKEFSTVAIIDNSNISNETYAVTECEIEKICNTNDGKIAFVIKKEYTNNGITGYYTYVEIFNAKISKNNFTTTENINGNIIGTDEVTYKVEYYVPSSTNNNQFKCSISEVTTNKITRIKLSVYAYIWEINKRTKQTANETDNWHRNYWQYILPDNRYGIPDEIKELGIPITNISKAAPPELLSWEFDEKTNEIKSGINSVHECALISNQKYKNYHFECVPYSYTNDDDMFGIIIGANTNYVTGLTNVLSINRWSETFQITLNRISLWGTSKTNIRLPNGTYYDESKSNNYPIIKNDVDYNFDTYSIDKATIDEIEYINNSEYCYKQFYITKGPTTSGGVLTKTLNGKIDSSGNKLTTNWVNVKETINELLNRLIPQSNSNFNIVYRNVTIDNVTYNVIYPYHTSMTADTYWDNLDSTIKDKIYETLIKIFDINTGNNTNNNNISEQIFKNVIYPKYKLSTFNINSLTMDDIFKLGYTGGYTYLTSNTNFAKTWTGVTYGWGLISCYNAIDLNPKFVVDRTYNPYTLSYEYDIIYYDILYNISHTAITSNTENGIKFVNQNSYNKNDLFTIKIKKENNLCKITVNGITTNISLFDYPELNDILTANTSYGYACASNPLTAWKNIKFVDKDNTKIYNIENEKIYTINQNTLEYEEDTNQISSAKIQIFNDFGLGRFVTNNITEKTFFNSKDFDDVINIAPILNGNEKHGVIIKNNKIDLSFIEENSNINENGVILNKSLTLLSKRLGLADNLLPNMFSIYGSDPYKELALCSDPLESIISQNEAIGSQIYLHGSKAYKMHNTNGEISTSESALPGQFGIHASGFVPKRDDDGKLIPYDSNKTNDSYYLSTTKASKSFRGDPEGNLVWTGSALQITSDERKKANIDNVPDLVLDAWGDVKWVQFNYKEELGRNGIKLHTGLIAQRINKAFENHNLKATDYGLVTFDELSDFWNVRYEEALAMEAIYQRRKVRMLEERIEKLEELLKVK